MPRYHIASLSSWSAVPSHIGTEVAASELGIRISAPWEPCELANAIGDRASHWHALCRYPMARSQEPNCRSSLCEMERISLQGLE